jgi:iron complex transport system substrate-binding protein
VLPSFSLATRAAPPGRLPAFFAVLVLTLAACSGGAATSTSPSAAATSAAPVATLAPSPSPSPAAAFPATLTDDEGTAVTIANAPQKIVSLTPATTEILFALGAGDRIVATDDGSDFPAEAIALPDVATFSSVDTEKVVAAGADLVVAGGLGFTPADAITKLRSLGIPVLVIYAPSVDGVLKDIDLLGAAVGASDKATEITDAMRADMKLTADAAAAEAAKAGAKERVYYEIGYTDGTGEIYAPADKSFLAEMVTLAGADAITTGDPNTYQIPLEKLIARDPQVIILGVNPFYSPTPTAVAARPGWKVMTAVKDGKIRPVNDIEITRPGPRLAAGLRALTSAIWPDISIPPAPSGG